MQELQNQTYDATKRTNLEKKNIKDVIQLFVSDPLKQQDICDSLFALALKNKIRFYQYLYQHQTDPTKISLQHIQTITQETDQIQSRNGKKFIKNVLKYKQMLQLTRDRKTNSSTVDINNNPGYSYINVSHKM